MLMADRIECWLVRHEANRAQIHAAIAECQHRSLRLLTVGGAYVADVATALRGSMVDVGVVVGYPLGNSKSTVKAIEATSAAKDGATVVTFVPLGHSLLKPDLLALKNETMEIVRAVRSTNPRVQVRLAVHSSHFTHAGEVAFAGLADAACRAARESGCDGIVDIDASLATIASFKRHSGGLTVIAGGHIATGIDARALLQAGADMIAIDAAQLLSVLAS
jgi:deoxyribose-phosphate aldolase